MPPRNSMRLNLTPAPARLVLLALCLAFVGAYLFFAARDFLAAHFAALSTVAGLERAVRLQPSNAEYHDQLGRLLALSGRFPQAAQHYNAATQLNPHVARYWLDQAGSAEYQGDLATQRRAIENAVRIDPRTPDVTWRAANFFLLQGQTANALTQFRRTIKGDPDTAPLVLDTAWRATHDVDLLLSTVLPADPAPHLAFLDTLVAHHELAATAKVWSHLIQLDRPFDVRRAVAYINYLIDQREIAPALAAWNQMASLNHMTAHLPSDNLIVNGGFDGEILNAGFDWQYYRQPGVQLRLDESTFRGGHRALAIAFEGPAVEEVKMFHYVALAPNTTYEFSSSFKTSDIEGAGGPRIVILDAYTGRVYYTSDDLKGAEVWRQISGVFTTGADAKLAILKILRVPEGRPIRGNLWLDDLQLVRK